LRRVEFNPSKSHGLATRRITILPPLDEIDTMALPQDIDTSRGFSFSKEDVSPAVE
jgi:hypothetical protein